MLLNTCFPAGETTGEVEDSLELEAWLAEVGSLGHWVRPLRIAAQTHFWLEHTAFSLPLPGKKPMMKISTAVE